MVICLLELDFSQWFNQHIFGLKMIMKVPNILKSGYNYTYSNINLYMSEIDSKVIESINKNNNLLEQKKYYQFSQKIKLFANRKIQTKKSQQAQSFFRIGAQKLYSIPEVDENIPLQLIDQLAALYIKEPELLTSDCENMLIANLKQRELTYRQINLVHRIIEQIGEPSKYPTLSEFYLNWKIGEKQFSSVELLAASLGRETSEKFVEAWSSSPQIKKEEIVGISCRMVLWRGIFHGIDEAEQIFNNVKQLFGSKDEPYLVFTSFLIKSVFLKSKLSFETLERSYSQFLNSDPGFSRITAQYGQRFFGIQRKKGGLLSLIQ